jgi:hypothetical protein
MDAQPNFGLGTTPTIDNHKVKGGMRNRHAIHAAGCAVIRPLRRS